VLLASACSLLTSYDGFEDGHQPVDSASDAPAQDAGSDTAPDPHACEGAVRIPPRPPANPDTSSVGTLVAAVSSIAFLESDASAPVVGFDIDRRCTCPGPPSCVSRVKEPNCDADGGVDNATQDIFVFLKGTGFLIDDSSVQKGIADGLYGIVFRVKGYSGAPDDPTVSVEFFNAFSVNDGGAPSFDGGDTWLLDQSTIHDDGASMVLDPAAYVAGGILVASIPRLVPKIRLPYSPDRNVLIDLEVNEAQIVAHVNVGPDGGVVLSEGRIVGRSSMSSWLTQIQRSGLCTSGSDFAVYQDFLCRRRDLPARSADDDKGADCQSISLAIRFEASVARIAANAGVPTESPSPCAADGSVIDASVGCPGE
jgi:hypothetical protein